MDAKQIAEAAVAAVHTHNTFFSSLLTEGRIIVMADSRLGAELDTLIARLQAKGIALLARGERDHDTVSLVFDALPCSPAEDVIAAEWQRITE